MNIPDEHGTACCGACGQLYTAEDGHDCDLAHDEDVSAGVVAIRDAILAEVLAQLDELSDDTIAVCENLAADEDDPADDGYALDRANRGVA